MHRRQNRLSLGLGQHLVQGLADRIFRRTGTHQDLLLDIAAHVQAHAVTIEAEHQIGNR